MKKQFPILRITPNQSMAMKTLVLLSIIMVLQACGGRSTRSADQDQQLILNEFSFSGKYLDISNETENARASFWKPDGSIVFITGRYSNNVAAYQPAEPWQIEVRGIEFLKNGSVMMLMDTERRAVLQYNLTKPYDITTAAYSGAFDVSEQTFQGRGLRFSTDKTIMFVTGRDEEKVFQYEVKK